MAIGSKSSTEQEEEEYLHFVSSIEDLNDAWTLLNKIRQDRGNPLIYAAFQFALIEYSKPYLRSDGKLSNHKLNDDLVPINYKGLHERILAARNKILAHSDLTVREAKLYVTTTTAGKVVGKVENIIYGTEELQNLDLIVDLIEKTLDAMYV